jgi:hypothetical protein
LHCKETKPVENTGLIKRGLIVGLVIALGLRERRVLRRDKRAAGPK